MEIVASAGARHLENDNVTEEPRQQYLRHHAMKAASEIASLGSSFKPTYCARNIALASGAAAGSAVIHCGGSCTEAGKFAAEATREQGGSTRLCTSAAATAAGCAVVALGGNAAEAGAVAGDVARSMGANMYTMLIAVGDAAGAAQLELGGG